MKRLHALLTPLVLVCAAQIAHAQTNTAAPVAQAPEPALTGGPGVYLVMKDKVWKDGKEFPLAYGSEASSLFVSGDDLYVAGNSEGDSFSIATVWKNGAAQKLDTVVSNATAVFVSGDDVYVAGTRGAGEGQRPVLWKNGEMQTLSEKSGGESWMPTHVSVWGKDVYVTGYRVRDPYIGDYVAMLWKNGKESVSVQPAPNSAVKLSDMTVLVSGGSVYVTATEKFGSGLKIWKDGRPVPGLKLGKEAKSTQVSGNFVYYLEDDKLFRNGVEQKLETFENPESLSKISTPLSHLFVSGNDVYVLGLRQSYYAGGKSNDAVKVLWKNGKAQVLDADQYLMVQGFFVAN
jgi:ketosteroid isomerase-like protein